MKNPTAKQRIEYVIYRGVTSVIGRLSDRSLERWSGRVARLASRLLKKRTALARTNLARVFPDRTAAEREEILDRCWEHFARMTLGYLAQNARGAPSLSFRYEGLEHFEKAASKGRGVIVVTAHFGDWEGAAAASIERGVDAIAIARRLDNPLLHERLQAKRSAHGVEMVDRRKAAKRMFLALRERKIVILLVDQAVKKNEGMLIPFLGRDAWTATSPAKLALKTGAPIVPLFCVRSKEGSIVISIDPPIDVDELSHDEREPRPILEKINRAVEQRIVQHPHLWLWMHNRWKGVP